MRYLGGHLGTTVTALVDGQLDPHSTDRAWAHVHGCTACLLQVEREGWVKSRLTAISAEPSVGTPPAGLLGALYGLPSAPTAGSAGRAGRVDPDRDASGRLASAWQAVEQIEHRERGRRRTGLAVVGAGSVSAAVFGLASLTGSSMGIAGVPGAPSPTAVSRPTAPPSSSTVTISSTVRVHGRLPRGLTASYRGPGEVSPSGTRPTGTLPPLDLQR